VVLPQTDVAVLWCWLLVLAIAEVAAKFARPLVKPSMLQAQEAGWWLLVAQARLVAQSTSSVVRVKAAVVEPSTS
jgi:hypothetical protein